ncbi:MULTISPECIES: phosphotransferase family protein [Cytobacillus]|uniref:phosphotransferase family protein n=1 Tax=Cytobacillus TaxID=2675230 RepID=UPI001D1530A4|nr:MULTISPECIES: phosphotransferase family protein [Cytobacillus]MCC3646433.1 phosphotransferase family protein [Cytobacillus oceanisediminis]MCS0653026.1 phosphotransferase family protein [Cytobacillus firmus]
MPKQMSQDTIPVRKGEQLNTAELEKFLRNEMANLPNQPLEILQFHAGHSNLTYQLKMGEWEAVLRRPPLGPVAPKAHDMEREYRVISEIHPFFKEAPKPILFTNNSEITGAPFFIMERRHGIVLDTSFPEGMEPDEEICRRLSQIMVDKLAELHSIDYKRTGLAEISNPDGFMERQVHGWIGRYERAKTDEVSEADTLKKWMTHHIPVSPEPSVIHYDYKLNNAMFNEDLTEMTGLFDWEMATAGDPLADLGAAMSYWIQGDDPDLLKFGLGKPPVTVLNGFYSRREFMEAYAGKTGRDLSSMNFYLTFAYFKLAVICQQIYYRYKKGQTADPRFSQFNRFVKVLLKHAVQAADEKI